MYNIDEENSEILFEVVGENIVLKLKNISGSGLNTPIYILKSSDATTPTENNVFSSLKVLSLLDQQKSTLDSVFEIKTNTDGTKTVHVKGNLYTDGGLSALGDNTISDEEPSSGLDYEALKLLLTGSDNAYALNTAFLTNVNKEYVANILGSTYSLSDHNHAGVYSLIDHSHYMSELVNDADYIKSSSLSSYALKSYVDNAIAGIINSAPSTLDTLNELSSALGNDPNFATSMTTLIGAKWTQDNAKISNWDAAYGWGNHANAGYAASGHNHNSLYAEIGHSHAGVYSVIGHTHKISDLFNDSNFVISTDIRLSDARTASDVYAWAKASTKPGYTFDEITSKPTTLLGYGIVDALSSAGGTISGILNIKGTVFSTGNIYVGDNRISLADGLPGIALNKAGGVEIAGTNPLIDFHFNSSATDYTSRIIEMFSGQLGFDCAVRIGDVATSNVISDKAYKFAVVGDSNFIGSIRATKTMFEDWSIEPISGELVFKKGDVVVAKFNALGFISMGGLTALG